VRQQAEATTTETTTGQCWTVEIENIPDVTVETSSSGSMMQEIFMVYAKHFVSALPQNHGPVILFLDGHGSHWNHHALQYFQDNKVFPFFLASHTSIWSQPNDAGVNKRFHWALEQECKNTRRMVTTATIKYCNSNFIKGWRIFLKAECDDLRKLGYNNATNAFLRTGLYPYNPFSESWMDAIDSISQAQQRSEGVHYEIFPNKDLPKLTDAESKILRDGLELYGLNLHDLAVAVVRSSHILGKWREEISKAVSEGEDYAAYSNILLPSPKTEPEKMAMRLLHFKRIDTNNLCPVVSKKKSKEEEALEITKQLVYTTKKAEPIFLTAYLSSSESDTDDDSASDKQTSPGTAIKKKTNEWHVYLENDQFMTATDEDLLDSNKFFVQQKCLDNDETTTKNNLQNKSEHTGLRRLRKRKQFEKRVLKEGMRLSWNSITFYARGSSLEQPRTSSKSFLIWLT